MIFHETRRPFDVRRVLTLALIAWMSPFVSSQELADLIRGEGHDSIAAELSPPMLGEPKEMPTLQPPPESSAPDPMQAIANSDSSEFAELLKPSVLRLSTEPVRELPPIAWPEDLNEPLLRTCGGTPYGFTGPSGIIPTEPQSTSHFIPVDDRWRLGIEDSDRYGKGHPLMDDYPGVKGAWWDPYNQNVLKGDYPIVGQHTFFKLKLATLNLFEGRELPTPTTPFEATRNPGSPGFFGDPDSFLMQSYNVLGLDLMHGNASFKPADWRIHADLIFNMNNLTADELGVVNPDVRAGTSRFRQDFALEQYFIEAKLSDLSPYYDFVSARVGSQPFVSDFRGFIFADVNRGARVFGTRNSNRDQFNAVFFDQTEKNINSLLNEFDEDRDQNTFIANYYRQDFLFPGFNVNASIHYDDQQESFEINENNFLVRPDPVGVAQQHHVRSVYLGTAFNGHIERFNYSGAFYQALGNDNLNPLAGREVDINAQMAALEISYDRDWARFRTSYFYSSGDDDPNDSEGGGFDAILPNPNFAGTEFSYWGRQDIRLFGVELTNRLSLTPSLRSNKVQGQPNFVNPGIHLVNFGFDADVTPRLKSINNVNLLWFEETSSLETYLFVEEVRQFIGTDISTGMEYRPLLNNNIVFLGGFATLIGGDGFRDLYQEVDGDVRNHIAGFMEVALEY